MDLKSFVSTSLMQIIEGIMDVQSQKNGKHVVAEGYLTQHPNFADGGQSGYFTFVDFDVSIVAEAIEGGDRIKVANNEVTAGSTSSERNSNRLKFTVPVRLPAGGENLDRSFRRGNYHDD